ncbi:MAG: HAD-IA family hydrolase [Cyanobacteria bacterium J06621_8]
MFRSITHIIYDLDGLLLDTESLNEQINREIARRYDRTFDLEVKMAIAGRTTLDSARIIVDLLQIPIAPDQYLVERSQLINPRYQGVSALPGTVELIKHLAAHDVIQAIATSSSRRNFELKTTRHQEWIKLMTVVTLGDDVIIKQGKPAPDIFLLTAARLNVTPENCLVFEDSLAGMKAAIAAGMSVVVIPDPIFEKKLFSAADQILTSMVEFQPQDWGLPEII